MLAIRTSISNRQNDTLLDDFVAGKMEPLFAACEAASLPLFCSTHGHAADLEPWIKRHPGLLFIVDHLGVPQPPPIKRDTPDPWQRLPGLLNLAQYENVAVKFSGATTLSLEPYPHRDIWRGLHQIIDAFTPARLFWGSDFTRLRMAPLTINPGPRAGWFLYSNELSYLRDTDEISQSEKEQIFGKSIRTMLRWPA
jgi:predicted TIM-barrel fold metal-dependent hydrolase